MALDQYGGYTSMPVPGGATGNFRVGKIGDRWVFATPEGNAFWMVATFNTDVDAAFVDLAAKYGGANPRANWGIHATRRLNSWKFNCVAEYSSLYVLATQAGVVKLPGMILARPIPAGLKNDPPYDFAPAGGAFKDVIDALAPGFTHASRTFPDVFDPVFSTYVTAYMAYLDEDAFWGGGLNTSPWCIGLAIDDIDDNFGFGPGPEITASRLHPHPAWYAICAAPTKASSTKHGQTSYTDTTVYAKANLKTFLQARYATIGALNTAWGSSYTTWDSAGGWGPGTGWQDEDGRHTTWLGSNTQGTLAGASAGVTQDLDDFLYEIAYKYFSIVTVAGRVIAPNQLIWGPASFNGWGGLSRKPILEAAGVWCDVLNAQIGSQTVAEKTALYTSDTPVVSWEGYMANPDSCLYAYPNLPPGDSLAYQYTFETQATRAANYTARMAFLLSQKNIVGLKFWSWADKWAEKFNWGLVSLQSNAYDAVEARVATGTDVWGITTGGEDFNYGNFLTSVIAANSTVEAALAEEVLVTAGHTRGAIAGAIV